MHTHMHAMCSACVYNSLQASSSIITPHVLLRVLRLLANAYSLHIAHLTTGMRIGAAAAEKLDLFPVRAPSSGVRHRHALVPCAAAACMLFPI